jgi:hypothetical protein
MRLFLTLAITGFALGGSGCALVDGVRVTTNRTKETMEDSAEWKRDKKWADDAWVRARQDDPNVPQSGDFNAGFHEGFATYVYRGGNGEPPPLPPRHYRALKYQTPQGYQAIENWFDGYRYGASVARESGCRQLVTGPAAVSACGPSGCSPCQPQTAPRPVAADDQPAAQLDSIVQAVAFNRQPVGEKSVELPADDQSPSFPLSLTMPDSAGHARITGIYAKPDPTTVLPHARITSVYTTNGPLEQRPEP